MRHKGHVEAFLGRRPPTVTLTGAVGGSTEDALTSLDVSSPTVLNKIHIEMDTIIFFKIFFP